MKKTFTLFAAALVFGSVAAQTPNLLSGDAAPAPSNYQPPTVQAPWQVLFSYDITTAGAGVGHAGVVPVGTDFWVSKWGSDTIDVISISGALSSRFTIPGVTGIRSLTTDGTFIYAGTNTADIKKINAATQTLVSTISVPSVANVRYCSYDATANSGAGGFWVGTWATDITLVDMSGAVLNTVLATNHGLTASYGMAVDNTNSGGPYLWSFHQTGTTTNNADLIQINIASGLQTTVMHDVTSDMGTPGDLAGGIFINTTPFGLVGVLQGSPNYLFSYDITLVGLDEANAQTDFIGLYPNPAGNSVNIHIDRTNNDPMQIQIVNAVGQVVSSSENVGMNNIYNIENLESGIYFVQVMYNGVMHSSKLVKE